MGSSTSDAGALRDALAQTSWAATRATVGEWYGRLLTQVVLLANGEPLKYVTGSYASGPDGTGGEGVITAFTERLMISANATVGGNDRPALKTFTIPRSALQAISVSGGRSAFSSDANAPRWPGSFTIVADYGTHGSIELPAEPTDNEPARESLHRFIGELVQDL